MTKLERKFVTARSISVEADGSFSGYASVFGIADLGEDVVLRGAFIDTLRQKGASGIRMLFQHDPDQPIGHWTDIREDEYGLAVSGVIDTNVEKGREVLSLLRSGSIDGLSIGFKTVEAAIDAETGIRQITRADLWEISIVTFPMLPQARVHDVKTYANVPSKRTFERWLVRDAGFSRRQANIIITKGYNGLSTARDAGNAAIQGYVAPRQLADLIRRVARNMHP